MKNDLHSAVATSGMTHEPGARQPCHDFQAAGLIKGMRGAGDDLEFFLAPQCGIRNAIEFHHPIIQTADDQQRGCADLAKTVFTRKIRPSAA